MKRTTIMLPDDLAQLVDRERRRRDVSAAAVIREAVAAYLVPATASPSLPFIGIARSGGTECLGRRAEEILEREFADWIEESSGLRDRRRQREATELPDQPMIPSDRPTDAGDR
ncbi:MAG TPA: CopG family transcriptional regulator [Thermomicrobiales bacterium]|jgi:hypothetical protein